MINGTKRVPKFHHAVITLFCIAAILSCNAKSVENQSDSSKESSQAVQPNIVFILADDLGYGHIGSYGQEIIKTPELDQLAKEGLRFTQAYSGSTVCAPSRSVLMTGQHTGHTTVRANFGPSGERIPLNDEDITVAEVLKAAGYTTGMIGKWGLGEPGTTGLPNVQGFDFWFGFLNQHKAHSFYPSHLWRNNKMVNLNENENGQRQTYVQDLFMDETLQFIRTNKENPFFLYLPFTLPHTELAADSEMMEQYRGKFDETPYPPIHGRPEVKEPKATYAAMVSTLDRDVGRILRELEKQGIAENTIVIFTSDNGPAAEEGTVAESFNGSGPLRGIKRDLYEGGIRVSLIVRWPNKVPAGQVDQNSQVAFWDFLPTFAELAGVHTPEGVDGISIVPSLLRGTAVGNDRPLYWEFLQNEKSEKKKAVRWGNWKAVQNSEKTKLELYDLNADIGETSDIAEQHPELVKKLKAYMDSASD